MLTIEQIANIGFRTSVIGGYCSEDVDAFIEDVQVSFEQLRQKNADLLKRLKTLSKKVEEYLEKESIRNTLLSAQKLEDSSVCDIWAEGWKE